MNISSMTGLLVLVAGVLVVVVMAPNLQRQGQRKTAHREVKRQVINRVQKSKQAAVEIARQRPPTLAELAAVAYSLRVQRSLFGLLSIASAAGGVILLANVAGMSWLGFAALPAAGASLWRYRIVTRNLATVMEQVAIQRARLVQSRLPKPLSPTAAEATPVQPIADRGWTPVELPAPRQKNGTLEVPNLAQVSMLPVSAEETFLVTNLDEILQRRRNAG